MAKPKGKIYQTGDVVDYTPSAAKSGGDVVQLDDGRAGIVLNDIAAAALGAAAVEGIARIEKAQVAMAVGDRVFFDEDGDPYGGTAGSGAATDLPDDGDFYVGRLFEAAAATATHCLVILNRNIFDGRKVVFSEFDCETGEDDAAHVLIPAYLNPNGLIITAIFGQVTEVMAGSSEDQGVVTVSDESDNALATLTASDAAADAENDVIEGYFLQEAATGDAGKVVAAGEYVDAIVTQETSGGTPAGKIKAFVEFIAL